MQNTKSSIILLKTTPLRLTFIAILFLLSNLCFAHTKEVKIVCSESDAEIFQDGKLVGNGTATIKIMANSSTIIVAKKVGFLDHTERLYNDSSHPASAKMIPITLKKDDSLEASVLSDIANNNIDLRSDKTEEKSWKLVCEVVSSTFDILEVADKSSGYLRTAWEVDSFEKFTIRTRVILKASSSESTSSYKIKIISERAEGNSVSAKEDEKFKSWGRLLKKYNELVPEIQDRLK